MPIGSLNSPSCKGRSPDKSTVERSPTKRRFASSQCSAALQPIFRRCSRNVRLLFTLLDPPKVSSALSLIICMNIRLTRSFAISSMKAIAANSVMKAELKLISSMRLIISRAVLGTSARSNGLMPMITTSVAVVRRYWCQRWIARIAAIPILLTIDLHGLIRDW